MAATASKRRTVGEIHRDRLEVLRERQTELMKLIADSPGELARLHDEEIRKSPAGTRPGATGPAHQFARRVEEARRELASVEGEIGSRGRLLQEAEAVEAKEQMKMLRRDAQDFAEREGVLLDALGEKAREFYIAFGAYLAEVEAKAHHLAGHSIPDSGTAEELRQAFQPVLTPLPLDAASAFDLVAEIGTSAEAQMAGQPVSEVGASLPDKNLDRAGFEEALRNQAADALAGNIGRPTVLRAPPVVRGRHRVVNLAEHVPDLVALDVRPSDAIPGPRFGKDSRGRPPAVGTQFAGVRADSMWPMPGEAA